MRARPPTAAEALAMLDDLYASLPALACKGRCHDSCTSIDASELERERLAARGITLSDVPAPRRLKLIAMSGEIPRCPALSPLNTCSVYDVRPFTCRAFGMVRDPRADDTMVYQTPMMCDHGCIPAGTISLADYVSRLQEIERLSRVVTGVRRLPLPEDLT